MYKNRIIKYYLLHKCNFENLQGPLTFRNLVSPEFEESSSLTKSRPYQESNSIRVCTTAELDKATRTVVYSSSTHKCMDGYLDGYG